MALPGRGPDAISPTAHYTGEVWRRNGLSDPALATTEGRLLFASLQPAMALSAALGGDTLEAFLLARHRLLDRLLETEIEAGRIGQVIELAAGLSPRGLRLSRRHPELTYVETDLGAMAARKRDAVQRAGGGHRVVELDALAASGPVSLAALAGELDSSRGLAVVSEGLLNYFPRAAVEGIWSRVASALSGFTAGLYVSDLHLRAGNEGLLERAFGVALGAFVRGRIHFPYEDELDARDGLERAGFAEVALHSGREAATEPGADRVRVIEARTA
jgi:O-methyltransferase involved in polyketide biosynthesis